MPTKKKGKSKGTKKSGGSSSAAGGSNASSSGASGLPHSLSGGPPSMSNSFSPSMNLPSCFKDLFVHLTLLGPKVFGSGGQGLLDFFLTGSGESWLKVYDELCKEISESENEKVMDSEEWDINRNREDPDMWMAFKSWFEDNGGVVYDKNVILQKDVSHNWGLYEKDSVNTISDGGREDGEVCRKEIEGGDDRIMILEKSVILNWFDYLPEEVLSQVKVPKGTKPVKNKKTGLEGNAKRPGHDEKLRPEACHPSLLLSLSIYNVIRDQVPKWKPYMKTLPSEDEVVPSLPFNYTGATWLEVVRRSKYGANTKITTTGSSMKHDILEKLLKGSIKKILALLTSYSEYCRVTNDIMSFRLWKYAVAISCTRQNEISLLDSDEEDNIGNNMCLCPFWDMINHSDFIGGEWERDENGNRKVGAKCHVWERADGVDTYLSADVRQGSRKCLAVDRRRPLCFRMEDDNKYRRYLEHPDKLVQQSTNREFLMKYSSRRTQMDYLLNNGFVRSNPLRDLKVFSDKDFDDTECSSVVRKWGGYWSHPGDEVTLQLGRPHSTIDDREYKLRRMVLTSYYAGTRGRIKLDDPSFPGSGLGIELKTSIEVLCSWFDRMALPQVSNSMSAGGGGGGVGIWILDRYSWERWWSLQYSFTDPTAFDRGHFEEVEGNFMGIVACLYASAVKDVNIDFLQQFARMAMRDHDLLYSRECIIYHHDIGRSVRNVLVRAVRDLLKKEGVLTEDNRLVDKFGSSHFDYGDLPERLYEGQVSTLLTLVRALEYGLPDSCSEAQLFERFSEEVTHEEWEELVRDWRGRVRESTELQSTDLQSTELQSTELHCPEGGIKPTHRNVFNLHVLNLIRKRARVGEDVFGGEGGGVVITTRQEDIISRIARSILVKVQ